MSRQQVRGAVADWVRAANITNLNQVLDTQPKLSQPLIGSSAGQQSNAVGSVFISTEQEKRIAVGGPNNGWKQVDYGVVFEIAFFSIQQDAENVMVDFDTLIDAVKNRLRLGGHRLGLPNGDVIFQAAESAISVNYMEPLVYEDGGTEIRAAIQITVTQMISA